MQEADMGLERERGGFFPKTGGAATTGRTISVTRQRMVNATPEAIQAMLANPAQLSQLLPQLQRMDVVRQGPGWAQVITTMTFGPLGNMKSEGDVRWTANEIIYRSAKPAPLEARWQLRAVNGGTEVTASLSLELGPMLGPLAAFVPQDAVAATIAPDLDRALERLARTLGPLGPRS